MKRNAEFECVDASSSGSQRRRGNEKETGRAGWSETHRAYLVALLVEFGAPEFRTNNGWNNRAWNEIFKRMSEKYPDVNYTRTQIKDQEQHLKKKYKSIKQLMSKSGFGWNNDLKMVETIDSVWKDILKNDKEARQWYNKPFPYYNDLHNLYEGCIAEGLQKRASNQYNMMENVESPLNTPSPMFNPLNDPFPWDDSFTNTEPNSSEVLVEMPPPQVGPTRISPSTHPTPPSIQGGQSNRAGRNKKAKITKVQSSLFDEEYYTYKKGEEERYISALKEMKDKELALKKQLATPKEGDDKYGVNAAIKAFKELNGFTFEDLVKATELFMSMDKFREAFLSFDPEERARYIRMKIDGV